MSTKIYCGDGTETDTVKTRENVYAQSNKETDTFGKSRDHVYVQSNDSEERPDKEASASLLKSVALSRSSIFNSFHSKLGKDEPEKVITVTGSSNEFLRLADKNGDGNVSIQEIEDLVKGNILVKYTFSI